jgi:hypothetical protein
VVWQSPAAGLLDRGNLCQLSGADFAQFGPAPARTSGLPISGVQYSASPYTSKKNDAQIPPNPLDEALDNYARPISFSLSREVERSIAFNARFAKMNLRATSLNAGGYY